MDNLDELYAACIVEYARKQNGAVLVGPAYVMTKDARDAFNLPYSEPVFRLAIAILEDVGALKRYTHKGMQPYYRIDSTEFDNAMKAGIMGVRSYQIRGGFGEERPDYKFLESVADLGPEFLSDAIGSYESVLSAVGDDGEVNAEIGIGSVPASDRVVSLIDNQKIEMDASATELIDLVEKQNAIDGDQSLKQQIIGQLKAGRELIRAGVFKLALIEQSILTLLSGLIEKYGSQAIGNAARKLLDLLIEHVVGK
jgi:hypothetical protein